MADKHNPAVTILLIRILILYSESVNGDRNTWNINIYHRCVSKLVSNATTGLKLHLASTANQTNNVLHCEVTTQPNDFI